MHLFIWSLQQEKKKHQKKKHQKKPTTTKKPREKTKERNKTKKGNVEFQNIGTNSVNKKGNHDPRLR